MGTKCICCLVWDPFELFSELTLEGGKPKDTAPWGDTCAATRHQGEDGHVRAEQLFLLSALFPNVQLHDKTL